MRGGQIVNFFGEADNDHVFITCHPGQPWQVRDSRKGRNSEKACSLLTEQCSLAFTNLCHCGHDDQLHNGSVDE